MRRTRNIAPLGLLFAAACQSGFSHNSASFAAPHFVAIEGIASVAHPAQADRAIELSAASGIPAWRLGDVTTLERAEIAPGHEMLSTGYTNHTPWNTHREYTEEEIAEVMGITSEKVREIIKVSQDPVSLETPIGEEEDSHLGDFVEDKEAIAPSDAANLTMLRNEVEDILDTLTPRERRVLQLRFGLIDGHQRTLEEVGKRFGVTRERIRQIEAKALRKLRHPSRSKRLKDYLE